MIERTLVVLKPDAVQRGIVGDIITRFEKAGLKIVGIKMLFPDKKHYFHHYETIGKMIARRGQEAFDVTIDFMQKGPVVAFVLEGIEAAELVRKMVGATEPKSASPGTIRGDYAHMSYSHGNEQKIGIPNIVHASGDANEAQQEIDYWFSKEELHNYKTSHESFTQPKNS